MDFWNKLNRDATRLFNAQQYTRSKDSYLQAVERAYFLYSRWPNYEESLKRLVVSLQGLAESHIQLNEFDSAGNTILKGHRLIQNLISFCQKDGEKRQALVKTQKQLASYIEYLLAEYPQIHICEDCYQRIFGKQPYDGMMSVQ